jgi:electron transfer flavoprotein alpha subunit
VVTVSPRRFQKEVNPRTVLVESPVAPTPGRVKVLERKQDPISDVNVSEADVVLCVGRGLAKQEDLALIEELAESIGGVIGCTRPISEDYSWLPTDRYIGLSGQKVQPKLYIALGSSGQIQHIAGCRDAKTIVAIDKDESAPIWEASDYGIVGDLYEIVPALIQELTKR